MTQILKFNFNHFFVNSRKKDCSQGQPSFRSCWQTRLSCQAFGSRQGKEIRTGSWSSSKPWLQEISPKRYLLVVKNWKITYLLLPTQTLQFCVFSRVVVAREHLEWQLSAQGTELIRVSTRGCIVDFFLLRSKKKFWVNLTINGYGCEFLCQFFLFNCLRQVKEIRAGSWSPLKPILISCPDLLEKNSEKRLNC